MAETYPPISPFSAGFACRCPRCGRGRLFSGYLDVAARCDNCGVDLSAHDSGDGPAVFLIFILGALIVPLAILLEVMARPPLWVHVAIWPVVILGLALGMLRPAKAIMVALHYKNLPDEHEGR
jgi:uncharacterized protein (DUF983 family)